MDISEFRCPLDAGIPNTLPPKFIQAFDRGVAFFIGFAGITR
jgi:hypothetical protein